MQIKEVFPLAPAQNQRENFTKKAELPSTTKLATQTDVPKPARKFR